MTLSVALPGFADPVADAQRCFRAVLDAMARPGAIHDVPPGLQPPSSLDAATAAVLLTLVDNETPLWLAADFAPARDWLLFHCGAACVAQASAAAFVLSRALPDFTDLRAGSHEAPEESATVILQITRLGSGRRYRLRGPGLRSEAVLAADGLPAGFPMAWARNHRQFPRGIDLILCAGTRLAALPRSVIVEAS